MDRWIREYFFSFVFFIFVSFRLLKEFGGMFFPLSEMITKNIYIFWKKNDLKRKQIQTHPTHIGELPFKMRPLTLSLSQHKERIKTNKINKHFFLLWFENNKTQKDKHNSKLAIRTRAQLRKIQWKEKYSCRTYLGPADWEALNLKCGQSVRWCIYTYHTLILTLSKKKKKEKNSKIKVIYIFHFRLWPRLKSYAEWVCLLIEAKCIHIQFSMYASGSLGTVDGG